MLCEWCHCETGTQTSHWANWRCVKALLEKVQGQDERIQALEEIARLAKQLLNLSPFEDWEWAEVHRDLGEALERVAVQSVKE